MQEVPPPDTPDGWSAASRGYAEKIAPVLMETFAEPFLNRLEADTHMEALEVGAGSGALTLDFAKRVKTLMATDFAPGMIGILRQRLQAAGVSNVRTETMDGHDLQFSDSSFDVAACSFALMLFTDRAKGFSELCRVLRPGGRAIVSGWAGPDKFESFGLFLQAITTAFPEMPSPPSPPAVFSLADPEDFQRQMESGGFRDVTVELVSQQLVVANFDEMWGMLTIGAPPVQMLFDRVGPGGKDRLRECLHRIIDDRFGSGPITTTNVATLGSGVAA